MVRLTSLVLLFVSQLFAQVALISDLDDTLKRTNVASPSRAIYNALFTQNVFSGMDELFKTMGPYADLHILSASPNIVRFNIKKLLRKHDLSPLHIFTRGPEDTDKFKFKYDAVKSVMGQAYEQVILMGDDVELDPEIYARYKADFPDKVLAVYIHKVTGADLPEGVTPYYTSYGLALREVAAGRMSVAEAWSVGEDFLTEDLSEAFPSFVVCPKTERELGLLNIEGLEDLTERIGRSIENYCRKEVKID